MHEAVLTSIGTQGVPFMDVEVMGYDESGAVTTTTLRYQAQTGAISHYDHYDAMDRLSQELVGAWDWYWVTVPTYTTEQLDESQAIVIDTRQYDGASREVRGGPNGSLPQGYVQALVGNNSDLSGATTTTSLYDAAGRLLRQHVDNEANPSADIDTNYSSTPPSCCIEPREPSASR